MIVVVRGGGARSDLAPFDSEIVARVIAELPIPVLTGIGHEVDRTVADEVAHSVLQDARPRPPASSCRASTSSAPGCRASRTGCRTAPAPTASSRRVSSATRRRRITRGAPAAIARESDLIDDRARRAAELGRRATRDAARAVAVHQRALTLAGGRVTRTADSRLAVATARLRALDPAARARARLHDHRDADGKVLTRAAAVAAGSTLAVAFADGTATARVERVEQDPERGGDG